MRRHLFYFLLLLVMAASTPVLAESAEPVAAKSGETGQNDSDSKLRIYAETGFEYNDNVFKLSESQISKMEANAVQDQAGGRFHDMKSVSDYIISPEVGLNFSADSRVGGRFSLKSWGRYNYYTKNQASSYPEGKVLLKNSICENGELILEGDFTFDYFKKNYVSAVDDENGNGNITRSERIYSAAVYDECDGVIAYKHKILNKEYSTISGLDIEPFTGYDMRKYNSTFRNRDQDISILGLGFNFEFFSRADLHMIYQYEWVSCPGDNELVLYDETVSGIDVTGDGVIKKNAPLKTEIDRSSRRYTIEVNPSLEIAKNTRIFVDYKHRITVYKSNNQLDIDHYDQRACRQKLCTGIKYEFLKAWSTEAAYSWTEEDEEDSDDYKENCYSIKLRYYF
jgi:hypothetical protein